MYKLPHPHYGYCSCAAGYPRHFRLLVSQIGDNKYCADCAAFLRRSGHSYTAPPKPARVRKRSQVPPKPSRKIAVFKRSQTAAKILELLSNGNVLSETQLMALIPPYLISSKAKLTILLFDMRRKGLIVGGRNGKGRLLFTLPQTAYLFGMGYIGDLVRMVSESSEPVVISDAAIELCRSKKTVYRWVEKLEKDGVIMSAIAPIQGRRGLYKVCTSRIRL